MTAQPPAEPQEQQSDTFPAVPDLSDPAEVRRLVQRHGVRPQKTFGQ
jgi:hypothetical protein